MRLAWDCIRPGGTVVVVGLAPRGVEVSLPAIEFLSDKAIRGSFYGSGDAASDLPRLAELAVSGELDLAGVVSAVEPFEAVNDALDRLRRGEGARTVLLIDPDASGYPA
jgi:S-(hydroxymethyl)glutathione dehydrogenase/alcohol dehydrogenase